MLLIPCDKCGGKGRTALPEELQNTMRAVGGRPTSAEQLHPRIGAGLTVNAMNRRLERLRELGLLQRHREGKTFFYSPTKKGKNFR